MYQICHASAQHHAQILLFTLFHPWIVTESKQGYFYDSEGCKFALWKNSKFFLAKKKQLTKVHGMIETIEEKHTEYGKIKALRKMNPQSLDSFKSPFPQSHDT